MRKTIPELMGEIKELSDEILTDNRCELGLCDGCPQNSPTLCPYENDGRTNSPKVDDREYTGEEQ